MEAMAVSGVELKSAWLKVRERGYSPVRRQGERPRCRSSRILIARRWEVVYFLDFPGCFRKLMLESCVIPTWMQVAVGTSAMPLRPMALF